MFLAPRPSFSALRIASWVRSCRAALTVIVRVIWILVFCAPSADEVVVVVAPTGRAKEVYMPSNRRLVLQLQPLESAGHEGLNNTRSSI